MFAIHFVWIFSVICTVRRFERAGIKTATLLPLGLRSGSGKNVASGLFSVVWVRSLSYIECDLGMASGPYITQRFFPEQVNSGVPADPDSPVNLPLKRSRKEKRNIARTTSLPIGTSWLYRRRRLSLKTRSHRIWIGAAPCVVALHFVVNVASRHLLRSTGQV